MSQWKGLDSGGTEQLWETSVLTSVLQVFKDHEPFSRSEPDSPIFDDLEDIFPDVTWRNYNSDGSFRPIFRKTNPWVKLGLTTQETVGAHVTSLGDELLSGEKKLNEIFIEATKNHYEVDGVHSFAVMSQAAIELPNEVFSLEDVEYAVSGPYCDGSMGLREALDYVRSRKITFPSGSRRVRTLRSFMNALVTAGVLINLNDGWGLRNISQANEIADIVLPTDSNEAITIDEMPSPDVFEYSDDNFKEIQPGKRKLPVFDPSSAIAHDPIKRALLLEKASSIHETLVEKCADCLRALGMKPLENLTTFDVATIEEQLLVEVKSINSGNTVSQLRKAIAQLPEYRWRHRQTFGESTTQVIITNENPAKYVDSDFIGYLLDDRKVKVFWLEGEQFVDSSGRSFEEFLTPLH